MIETDQIKLLRIALVVVGAVFVVGVYPLTIIWPSGWAWHSGQSQYLQMILGLYATLGVFLIIASRNPRAHRSLIWFTVWSSVVHGAIMAIQSVVYPEHIGHLWGDVLALFVVAAVLAYLMPRSVKVASNAGLTERSSGPTDVRGVSVASVGGGGPLNSRVSRPREPESP